MSLSHELFHGYELLEALECGGMAQAYRASQAATGKVVFLKRVPAMSTDNAMAGVIARQNRVIRPAVKTRMIAMGAMAYRITGTAKVQ